MHNLSQQSGFEPRPSTREEIGAYVDACSAESAVRPSLLSNPMARTNWRSVGHERLRRLMPEAESCVSTPSLADLPWAVGYLLFQRGCNLMIINGGDGTIHHTVNATIEVVAEASKRIGRPVPLPPFLFVNGGGMNMMARAFGTRGHPVRTLRRFLGLLARDARLGRLKTRNVPILEVTEPDGTHRCGFIFGSELTVNALLLYERFGQGYLGLARFLSAATLGYAFETELWHRYEHYIDPPDTPLQIDGVIHPTYMAAVATTVPMLLLKGLLGTIREPASPGTMNTVTIFETRAGPVISTIPRLMLGREGQGFEYLNGVRKLKAYGPYSLDGEVFRARLPGPPIPRDDDAPVVVSGSDRVVRGISLA